VSAARRLGEMLKEQGLNPGGRPTKTGTKTEPVIQIPTLAAIGKERAA
jgi:hypothetical protein